LSKTIRAEGRPCRQRGHATDRRDGRQVDGAQAHHATSAGDDAELPLRAHDHSEQIVAFRIQVRAADIESMRETFVATVEGFTSAVTAKGGTLVTTPVAASVIDGINIDQFGWELTAADGAQWVITGLLAAKPNADRQHLLTFARVK
jgi:hypothetical protein